MGAWGVEPWANDTAADWFSEFFEGVDIDSRIESAFEYEIDEDYDKARAACYILEVLGRIYVWPGDVDKLRQHLDRGIEQLEQMVDPKHPTCQVIQEMCGPESEIFDSIRGQLEQLRIRKSKGNWSDVGEKDDPFDLVASEPCKKVGANNRELNSAFTARSITRKCSGDSTRDHREASE